MEPSGDGDRGVRPPLAGDADVATVAHAARARGAGVAVVIPALNEAATVGPVVETIGTELVHGAGLVTELLVVDGGSTDGTATVAAAAGARVVDQGEALRGAGPGGGKGDALWKGLARTSADLVVFVDADVVGFAAWWVAALVRPLLDDPRVGLVKASYRRPLTRGGSDGPAEGGRVTELTARPLLNAFWPALAAVVQPLAGEYAGRRAVLEQVPFATGYGVEIGLLIDVADLLGPDGIAQVELGDRRHAHQPLPELGRMASEVTLAVATRLHREGRLTAAPADRLLQPRRDAGRASPGVELTGRVLRVDERPALRRWRGTSPA